MDELTDPEVYLAYKLGLHPVDTCEGLRLWFDKEPSAA